MHTQETIQRHELSQMYGDLRQDGMSQNDAIDFCHCFWNNVKDGLISRQVDEEFDRHQQGMTLEAVGIPIHRIADFINIL